MARKTKERPGPIREGWLTVSQAAAKIERDRTTLLWQIKNGRLKATQLPDESGPGLWFIHEDDLEEYVNRAHKSEARRRFPYGVPDQRPPEVTDEQWDTLIKHVNEGWSFTRLAEEDGISREAVRSRLDRALAHFTARSSAE